MQEKLENDISMKFFMLVTDREIRGAFFCLGILFSWHGTIVKIYSDEFDEKMFFCVLFILSFEHFAFLDESILVLFNITGSHHGNGNVGYT
jgi:hypothetical protein